MREAGGPKARRYLLVLVLSTLGAVFLVDPKLGMPRDWDLFSFCGIPISVFICFLTLKMGKTPWKELAICLMIILGIASLLTRATRQTSPILAIAEFKSYAALDPTKNRVGRNNLIDYYKKTGQQTKADYETLVWYKDYPERNMLSIADSLLRANLTSNGIQIIRELLSNNPYYPSAYNAIGMGYMDLNEVDSAIAYLEIANAMNPGNTQFRESLEEARKAQKAKLDSLLQQ
jgi:tetratricopeptide (TPR) repeat protein